MCRMVGFVAAGGAMGSGNAPSRLPLFDHLVVHRTSLATQAEQGNVPAGLPPGHEDGWGVGAFDAAGLVSLIREIGSARSSAFFRFAVSAMENGAAGSGSANVAIGHLRKATRGAISSENSQPIRLDFRRAHGGRETILVAHNGTVYEPLLSTLRADLADADRGEARADSDSIVLAAWLAHHIGQNERDEDDFTADLADALREILGRAEDLQRVDAATKTYSGLNLLIANGSGLYALRQFTRLPHYYTLFCKQLPEGFVLASEPTDDTNNWEPLPPGVLHYFPANRENEGVSGHAMRRLPLQ